MTFPGEPDLHPAAADPPGGVPGLSAPHPGITVTVDYIQHHDDPGITVTVEYLQHHDDNI